MLMMRTISHKFKSGMKPENNHKNMLLLFLKITPEKTRKSLNFANIVPTYSKAYRKDKLWKATTI